MWGSAVGLDQSQGPTWARCLSVVIQCGRTTGDLSGEGTLHDDPGVDPWMLTPVLTSPLVIPVPLLTVPDPCSHQRQHHTVPPSVSLVPA